MTEAEARRVLKNPNRMAEFYGERLEAQRRLVPVTTEAERAAAKAYVRSAPAHRCVCGAKWFGGPRTSCYGCRGSS